MDEPCRWGRSSRQVKNGVWLPFPPHWPPPHDKVYSYLLAGLLVPIGRREVPGLGPGLQGSSMKATGCLVFVAAIAWVAANVAHAQTVYKSIGPDGSIVYSDKPPANGKIEKTFTFVDLPSSSVPGMASQPSSSAPMRRIAPNIAPGEGVVMFSANWCGYCKRAKAYLATKGIPYRSIDIDSASGKAEFTRMHQSSIPLVFYKGKAIRGFDVAGYDAFFAGR